ncbi:S24 family peptidase [Achromobacter sp. AONIH1]|uniref:XRE family transcriptional regulator n=1 Tax=Achromobacter sp. AONIH1 TaxID=1758194 RepID=UPI0018F83A6A|nr:S24 family peptidase [Achromobacter sp. AONIH1]
MENLSSRVLARRAELGLSQADLAKAAGISQSTIAQIERGRNRGSKYILALADALNTTARWLLEGADSAAQPKSPPTERARRRPDVEIPQFETGGAMGKGLELHDQPGIIQAWHVSSEWLHKNIPTYSQKENLCIVTGFGDSMRPLFNPGDPLVVDRGVRSVDYDGVYFFRVGNQGFIKRLQTIPIEDGFVLRAKSENAKYDSWDITEKMDFEVFGRVLKVWCSHDF